MDPLRKGSGLDPARIEAAKALLLERLAPELIVLFGSASSGGIFRPESDVDLAFLSDLQLGDYDRFELAQELAIILARDVDLVDLNKSSTVLKKEILAKGQILHEQDHVRGMMWRMRVLKEYAILNEERAPILKARFHHAR